MSIIHVSHLSKSFRSYRKEAGLLGSIKSLVYREYENIHAVEDISFDINEGELVGFIGPNGAGKTTTLKMLSGLLYPSSGTIKVLGYEPFARKNEFLKQIALVMGQKNQLWWDLPAIESFLLNKEIYEIPEKKFKKTLDELASLLEVEEVLNVQVRKLSLGQRMKCELIAAILHSPKVLFLDEPTIGLDVVMQQKLRDFIKQYNKEYRSTIILTSHYMEDVKELCKRVIVIDHGKIMFDGELEKIVQEYTQHKLISLVFNKRVAAKDLDVLGTVKEYDFPKVTLSVARRDANKVAAQLLEHYPVEDLNIEEEAIEDIIREVFSHAEDNH